PLGAEERAEGGRAPPAADARPHAAAEAEIGDGVVRPDDPLGGGAAPLEERALVDDGAREDLGPDDELPVRDAHAGGGAPDDLAAERVALVPLVERAVREAEARRVREKRDVSGDARSWRHAHVPIARVFVARSRREVRREPERAR